MNAQLSKSQRACLAAEALPMIEAETRDRHALTSQTRYLPPEQRVNGAGRSGDAVQVAGRQFGVSGSLVQRAKRIKLFDPALFERVKAGEMTLQPAVELYRHKKPLHAYGPRADRVAMIRELASKGYRASQIGSELGVSEGHVKNLARSAEINLPDAIIGRERHVLVSRVIGTTIEGLEGYVLGLRRAEGHTLNLDPALAGEWADSLTKSLAILNNLRRALRRVQRGN